MTDDFIRSAWNEQTQTQREQANDLARRAIEAAERRRAEPAELEDRLRHAADSAGRLTIDAAISAMKGERAGASFNDQLRSDHARAEHRQEQGADEQLFSGESEAEPSTRPSGDADGGKGAAEEIEVERVATDAGIERMRVWPIDNDSTTTTKETK